jgi:hypothetical protein
LSFARDLLVELGCPIRPAAVNEYGQRFDGTNWPSLVPPQHLGRVQWSNGAQRVWCQHDELMSDRPGEQVPASLHTFGIDLPSGVTFKCLPSDFKFRSYSLTGKGHRVAALETVVARCLERLCHE